jgi:uncharacterized membrane protein YhhN
MKKISIIIFVLAAIVELSSKFLNVELAHLICKPMLMVALGFYYFFSTSASDRSHAVLAAISFSFIGDVLLMLPDQFTGGLVAFLLGHVAYIVAYRQHRDEETENVLSGVHRMRLAFPIILAGTGLVIILYPVLGAMRLPVIVYAIVLCFMVLQALFRFGRTNVQSFWMVFAGAVLFMISDSTLAIDKFLDKIFYADFLIMLTYITAQYLIVRGLIRHYA